MNIQVNAKRGHATWPASVLVLAAACQSHTPQTNQQVREQALSQAKESEHATPSSPAIDQSNLCEVSEWRYDAVAEACKPGQKVVYLPNSWGNDQLPILFSAVNCDLRYSVALTKGAVTCIYGPITPTPPKTAKKTPEPSVQDQEAKAEQKRAK